MNIYSVFNKISAQHFAINTYKQLENAGATQTEIEENFNRPIPMQMFAWNNSLSVERIISPLDSIKISLQILQAALLSLDPKSGAVRA